MRINLTGLLVLVFLSSIGRAVERVQIDLDYVRAQSATKSGTGQCLVLAHGNLVHRVMTKFVRIVEILPAGTQPIDSLSKYRL